MQTNLSRLSAKRAIVVIFKHWILIASVVLISTAVTAFLNYRSPDVYRGTMTVAVNPEAMRSVSLLRKETTVSNASMLELITTEMGMLLSGRVVEQAWTAVRPDEVAAMDPQELRSRVNELRNNLSSIPQRNAQISNIQLSHRDPAFLADLLNQLVPARIDQLVSDQRSRVSNEFEQVRRQTEQAVDSLDMLIARLQTEEQQFDPDQQVRALINQRSNNELQLVEMQQEALRLGMRVDSLRARLESGETLAAISVGETGSAVYALRADLRRLDLELQEKTSVWADDHPEVRRLVESRSLVAEQLKQELHEQLARRVAELEVLQAEIDSRQQVRARYNRMLEDFPYVKRQLARLEQERENRQSMLLVLQNQKNESEITSLQVQSSQFLEVISPASMPVEPVAPRRILNTVVALILSFSIMILMAFFLESASNVIETPDELEELLGESVLASVQEVKA